MSTLIRTDHVSAADRLDFVREMTAATWVPMDCRAIGDRASYAKADYVEEFRASGLGAMQVVVMDVMPISVQPHPRADLAGGSGHAEDGAGARRQLVRG